MNYQELWDDCLIRGWKSDIPMQILIMQFILNVDKSLIKSSWIDPCYFADDFNAYTYITALGIKRRCMDRLTNGELAFHQGRGCVRAFIAKRSPQISGKLFSGCSADDVLSEINTFKWSRSKQGGTKAKSKRAYNYSKSKGNVNISARSLSYGSSWGTVK
jgi:hypothetical protein